MSNTDPLSFAPESLRRGASVTEPNGKTSFDATAAATAIESYPWSGHFGQATTVTYAYRVSGTVTNDDSSGFGQFNAAQIAQAEKALTAWSDVANIHFTRIDDGAGYSNNATILLGDYTDGPAAGFTYLPGSRAVSSEDGDVWINNSLPYNATPTIGNYGGQVLVHELGHALGLTHPGDYDSSDKANPTYSASADHYEDSRQYTVMSYFDETNTNGDFGNRYSAVPLLDDVTAAQALYGANMTTRTDDTVYGFHSNTGRDWFSATSASSELIFAAWDAGGNDTFDFSGYTQSQVIDLRAGNFSDIGGYQDNVAIAYNVTIENAIGGSSTDRIIGNVAANVLDGGSGNDMLYGESGNDTLHGGIGNDVLDGGSGRNVIDGGDGTDILLLAGVIADYHSTLDSSGYIVAGNGMSDTISAIETIEIGTAATSTSYSLASFLAQTPGPVTEAAQSDVTGEGYSDIVWRNANGATTFWSAGATGLQGSSYGASVDGGWKIIETFDMNGDDRADLLWRNQNGTIVVWTSNGAGFTANTYGNSAIGNEWQIAATGDFDGDGKDDLLWRYQDGSIQIWKSTGTSFAANSYSHASVGTSWKVDGVADFNGDGKDDILWRNDNGTIQTWLSTGSGFTQVAYQNASVGNDWHIAGLADFNGDGKDDLLWRNQNGAVVVWSSNGTGFTPNTYGNNGVGNDWHIVGTGDYNDDGRADILWRNDGGSLQVWASTGTAFSANALGGFADSGWSVIGHVFPQ